MATHPSIGPLQAMKNAGVLNPYIDYVRFPRFRNLEPDTRIDFSFPFTVFVGQNGCGKSSALQAIYGCPKGRSVGTYWFTTLVDPIKELAPEDRHCLIYGYDEGGESKEVLKTRINKEGQPDLWDTSEPILRYGMTMGARNPPLEKHVVYFNFRAVQSAFEKAFHEERPPASGIQDHLRHRSWYLRRLLDGHRKLPNFHGQRTHTAPVQLAANELEIVGGILGRDYISATILEHRLFGHWGSSVMLTTRHASYSEAFAGSGETAVVLLVHEMLQAPERTLFLLDEPETSLHPGAQRRVLDLLLGECVKSRHQVIMCTHSPNFVSSLPPSAVKVFTPIPTGCFRIAQNVLPEEAFFVIGEPLPHKLVIRVEDRVAKLLEEVLSRMDVAAANLFEVVYYPGGTGAMKQDATTYSRDTASGIHLLFDGDQMPEAPVFDPGTMQAAVEADPDRAIAILTQEIRNAAGEVPRFAPDGGVQGGNKVQLRDLMKQYLRYFRARVHFFPMESLEDEIWDGTVAKIFLASVLSADQVAGVIAKLAAEPSCKRKFVILSEALCDSSSASALEVLHKMLIKAWATRAPKAFGITFELLNSIKNRA